MSQTKPELVLGLSPSVETISAALITTGYKHLASAEIDAPEERPIETHAAAPLLADLGALTDRWKTEHGRIVAVGIRLTGDLAPPPDRLSQIRRRNRVTTAEGLLLAWVAAWPSAPQIFRVALNSYNSQWRLMMYPSRLVSDSEKQADGWRKQRAGKGRLQPQRSAFDVALAALRDRDLLAHERAASAHAARA